MDANAHLLGLGKIVANLQTLEILLRIFLCDATGQTFTHPKASDTSLPESYLTNYDTLGKLIDDYNATLGVSEEMFQVDRRVVSVRDALAHGRLMAAADFFPLTLYRFAKPANGAVSLLSSETLTECWFASQSALIRSHLKRIVDCSMKRKYPSIGPAHWPP